MKSIYISPLENIQEELHLHKEYSNNEDNTNIN